MRTTIRRARATDAAELTRVAHAAKRYWRYPEKLIRLWRADLTVTPEAVVHQPVYCALRAGEIAGFYAISGERGTCELEHLWVDPRCIGTGVGRKLFTHLLRRLGAMQAKRMRIASDPNAEGFYLRMGARRIGRAASTPAGRYLPVLEVRLQPSEAGARSRAPTRTTRTREPLSEPTSRERRTSGRALR